MLSCCSPEGLVSKKCSAHVCALHARGPCPWRKRSISLEWPKRLLSAQFCRGNSPPPMRILSFDSQNHPTEQILIYPFYKWGNWDPEGEDTRQVSIRTGLSPALRPGSWTPCRQGQAGRGNGNRVHFLQAPTFGEERGGSPDFFSGCSEKFTLPVLSGGCQKDQPWFRW